MMYYRYVDFLVRALAVDARSLIDVGSANAQYIENFDWIQKRHTLDIRKPYSSENVAGIETDFFDFEPEEKYDFATCLQALEHIPDAKAFARKLFEVAERVLISVPYNWRRGSNSRHVHDPVDAGKLLDWTGREPSYSVVVEEPLSKSSKRNRLICYYHPEGEKLDLARARENLGGVPEKRGNAPAGTGFRLFGSEVGPGAYLFAAATKEVGFHFGQSAEDAILTRIFRGRTEGFYVDVGAFHPRKYSNTFVLHHFFGWSGVNIDASSRAITLFEKERPADTNVQTAVGGATDEVVYWKFDSRARNTISEDNVQRQLLRGDACVVGKEKVRTRPLADVLAEHVPEGKVIDLLNIDIEGADFQALVSNDWRRYRPRVITVEDYAVGTVGLENSEIYSLLSEKGYRFSSHAFDTSIYIEEDFLKQNEDLGGASSDTERTGVNFSDSSLREVPGAYNRAEALARSHPEAQSLLERNKVLQQQLREQLKTSETRMKLLDRELKARRRRNRALKERLEKRDSDLEQARREHRKALRERDQTQRQRDRFRGLYVEIRQSRWWRYTLPLRKIAGAVRSRVARRPGGPGA